jgi:hypothetical protein
MKIKLSLIYLLWLIESFLSLRVTLEVPSNTERCIGEFIPKNEHMDFNW